MIRLLAVFMVLVPQLIFANDLLMSLMNATFKVFNSDSTATGFIIQDTRAGSGTTNVILVTADHALAKAKGDFVLVVCRRKNSAGVWERYDHKVIIRNDEKKLWVSHPTQDIAALRFSMPPNVVYQALDLSQIAEEKELVASKMTVGTDLFFFSYPGLVEANSAAFPLYRPCVIAGYPLFPTKQFPVYRLSMPAHGGDSGAPVSLAKTANGKPLIVGLVTARMLNDDKLETKGEHIEFKRDLDIGCMVQSPFIRETIQLLDTYSLQ
ncbi:MAG: hypothetical protein WCJ02_17125 [bacterium]